MLWRILMNKFTRFWSLSVLCASLLTAAPSSIAGAPHATNNELLAMKISPSTSSDFALKLFSSVAGKEKSNVLISPFSAYAALCMTLNGAVGKTHEQMAEVLGVKADTIAQLNAHNKELFAGLNANKNVQIEVANAIFADSKTPVLQSFIDLCKSSYDAEVHDEDFNAPSTVDKVNNWCNTKTHGKINKILDSLSPDEKMILLSAIYFKAAWEHQFSKGYTVDDKFTKSSGDKVPVKMMHQTQDFLHYKGKNFASIAVPYVGGSQSMYIFLPDTGVDISLFQSQITSDNWNQWMQAYKVSDVRLSLPKFKITFSAKLNDALAALGMPDAFSAGKADFSQMIKQRPTWISRVLQKTYMDVNEEGTEAAAVTAVVMATRSIMMRPEPVVEFKVDRPFVVAIVDNKSKEILFLGTIKEP
jgi:serpin B